MKKEEVKEEEKVEVKKEKNPLSGRCFFFTFSYLLHYNCIIGLVLYTLLYYGFICFCLYWSTEGILFVGLILLKLIFCNIYRKYNDKNNKFNHFKYVIGIIISVFTCFFFLLYAVDELPTSKHSLSALIKNTKVNSNNLFDIYCFMFYCFGCKAFYAFKQYYRSIVDFDYGFN